ncbi:MAG: hypothetical protein L3J93_04785, partial [Thermoplasmata archaeon]|nr:hypothetical protein [Thermoplasmata archaeon]
MTSFDPFLYVALAAGFVGGRVWHPSGTWIPRATEASIVTLVFILGATIGSFPVAGLLSAIPLAFLFTAILLGSTGLAAVGLSRVTGTPRTQSHEADRTQLGHRTFFPIVLVVALVAGAVVGYSVCLPVDLLRPLNLYLLLILVGLG